MPEALPAHRTQSRDPSGLRPHKSAFGCISRPSASPCWWGSSPPKPHRVPWPRMCQRAKARKALRNSRPCSTFLEVRGAPWALWAYTDPYMILWANEGPHGLSWAPRHTGPLAPKASKGTSRRVLWELQPGHAIAAELHPLSGTPGTIL